MAIDYITAKDEEIEELQSKHVKDQHPLQAKMTEMANELKEHKVKAEQSEANAKRLTEAQEEYRDQIDLLKDELSCTKKETEEFKKLYEVQKDTVLSLQTQMLE